MEEYQFNIRIDEELYGVTTKTLTHSLLCSLSPVTYTTLKFKPKARQIIEEKLKWDPELKERFLGGFPILVG